MTYEEAKKLAELARAKGLVLFEAITNQYNANYEKVRELLPGLGDVKIVQLNFSQYSSRYEAFKQGNIAPVFDAAKAGGALMDLNVYNIHFVVGLFGEPKAVHYYPNMEKGVDMSGILVMEYPTFQCVCVAAKDCGAPLSVNIEGDKGCMFSHSNSGRFEEFSYQENKQEPIHYELARRDSIFAEELTAFTEYYVNKNQAELDRRLEHSLRVMKVLDAARRGSRS